MVSSKLFAIISILFGIIAFGLLFFGGGLGLAISIPGLLAGGYAIYKRQHVLGVAGLVLCASSILVLSMALFLQG